MADISGRRDRNKKSPGVHYDMHRCTRAAVICTVSLQNAWVSATRRRGPAERAGGARVCTCMLRGAHVGVHVFRIVSNDGQRGAAEEQQQRRDTAAVGISM